MSSPVQKQVQRGNPKAIESLVRQFLQRRPEHRSVTVKVERRNASLFIRLRANAPLSQAKLVAELKQLFSRLAIAGVNSAQVVAHRAGQQEVAWTARIPVRSRSVFRLSPALMGKTFAGLVLLTLVWGIGAMVRGPSDPEVVQANAEETQADTTESNETSASPDEAAESADGPGYTVTREEIFDGKRIQIDTDDPDLTEAECIAIAAKFLEEAGVDGKVVVQKPNPKPPWSGKRAPYCANNNNGYGTFFNNEYF